jgi:hypothetical protein
MLDVLYVAGSVLFFLMMLGYVRACQALGKVGADGKGDETP